jgi:hypothetical protein
MRLMDVRTDTATPFAIERRIFQCSSCRQTAQRLGFDRSGLPNGTAPVMKTDASAISIQPGPYAGEKLVSRQVALKSQQPVDWSSVVGNVSTALKQQAVAARAASWAKTLEKLRGRQMALKEQAAPLTTADRDFNRVWKGQCPDGSALNRVASSPELRGDEATPRPSLG